MKFLINLYSPVDAFCGSKEHFQPLFEIFGKEQCVLAESKEHFRSLLPEAEAVFCWNFPKDFYSFADQLKLIVTPAAGRDWVAPTPSPEIQVEFSSFHGPMIAESFLAMMLFFNNQFIKQLELQGQKTWDRNACVKRRLLKNQSLLILGCGNIGQHCAALVKTLGMKVVGVNRRGIGEGDFSYVKMSEISDIIEDFDHVLSLIPGEEENEKVLGDKFFSSLKSGAHFYNFGRGSVVDEESLLSFLSKNPSSFAGLDVTYNEPLNDVSPLYVHKQILLTPHNSCTYEDYLHLFVAEFIERFELGQFPSLKA